METEGSGTGGGDKRHRPQDGDWSWMEELDDAMSQSWEAVNDGLTAETKAKSRDAWASQHSRSWTKPLRRRRRRRREVLGRVPGRALGPYREVMVKVQDGLWTRAREAVARGKCPTLRELVNEAIREFLDGMDRAQGGPRRGQGGGVDAQAE